MSVCESVHACRQYQKARDRIDVHFIFMFTPNIYKITATAQILPTLFQHQVNIETEYTGLDQIKQIRTPYLLTSTPVPSYIYPAVLTSHL